MKKQRVFGIVIAMAALAGMVAFFLRPPQKPPLATPTPAPMTFAGDGGGRGPLSKPSKGEARAARFVPVVGAEMGLTDDEIKKALEIMTRRHRAFEALPPLSADEVMDGGSTHPTFLGMKAYDAASRSELKALLGDARGTQFVAAYHKHVREESPKSTIHPGAPPSDSAGP